ncbi:class I SAM-dependent methyltransferase [Mycobacterium sp. 236(2023)]|uniref:class I SAM-dependent methyltransferase n=1 Tax=Mycobacterium sp. 236(2023) TaxID=3038163 RepID=UPI00241502B9|nr:class I SAM-dependent methyltransferase [Mycobacterium sp. 236(2023)]MDG4663009.1 class I SAM-dependent methyltransferase [Mycobacterium sp. 236(2023)]
MSEAMSAEFDTVAEWTAEVARDLGPDFWIPAGCRGSGNPAALDWLVDELELRTGESLLDCGAGVGGPAAYAAQLRDVAPVLIDPERGACRAARSLFGYPAAQASAARLPVDDETFDAAWCLGVLCTMPDQSDLLTELRRVVRAPGRIGLLVFLAEVELSPEDQPEGNHFPTEESLQQLLSVAGLTVVRRRKTADLPEIPASWQSKVDAVEDALRRRHGHEQAWRVSEKQSDEMGRLLGEGLVTGHVLSLRGS